VNTGTVSVSGALTATLTNAVAGSFGFHKTGTGELIVGGGTAGSYFTGAASIDAGVLNVNGPGPMSTSAWTIGNANLRVRASTTLSNAINFSAGREPHRAAERHERHAQRPDRRRRDPLQDRRRHAHAHQRRQQLRQRHLHQRGNPARRRRRQPRWRERRGDV
jgi:autotransporter-associated beta strand protein